MAHESVSAGPLRAGALGPGDVGGGVRLERAVQDRGSDQGAELLGRLRDREPGGEHGPDEFLAPPGRELTELPGDHLGAAVTFPGIQCSSAFWSGTGEQAACGPLT